MTRIGDTECNLCLSADEELFVEVLIVQATYHRRAHPDVPTIRLTDEQIRRTAAARGGRADLVWDNKQMARLKKKYISGTGRSEDTAATRFELLILTSAGRRALGRQAATPSVYRPTGIELLIRHFGGVV